MTNPLINGPVAVLGLLDTGGTDEGQAISRLRIPHWDKVLELAASCTELTGLGYIGAEVVLDRKTGPMMLELNARPGLSIQVANQAGLMQKGAFTSGENACNVAWSNFLLYSTNSTRPSVLYKNANQLQQWD